MEPITNENIKDLVKRYLDGNSGLPEINSWDVSNVTDMSKLFRDAYNFNEPLNDWNVSNVTKMNTMFYNASRFNQPLNSWIVSKVTNMSNMFNSATEFNQPLNSWNVSKVTNMTSMFQNAYKFDQPLDLWDVSKVTDMSYMFYGAKKFNQPLNSWIVSNIRTVNHMFDGATNFDIINLPNNSNIRRDFIEYQIQPRNLNQEFDDADDDNPENGRDIGEVESEFLEPGLSVNGLASELYNELSSSPLTNSTETINLQNSGYDAISMEEIQFSEYLKQDIANILIQYNGNMYFANKNSIKALVLDGSAIKYGCKTVSTSIVPKRDNLYDEPCFNMNSIGIISGLVYLSKIKTILETSELKVFKISREPIMNYVSTASLQMLSNEANAVSASHCQEGQNANVFDITLIPYESMGGKKTRKTKKSLKKTKKNMKKTKKNQKKIRKTIKSRKIKKY